MIKSFFNTTDNFLCNNLKAIFEKTEYRYKNEKFSINLPKELENLTYNSLVSREYNSSNFEKSVKLRLKILLGIFFVAVPFLMFIFIASLLNLEYSYAFIATFAVALLANIRMDEITKKYAKKRCSEMAC